MPEVLKNSANIPVLTVQFINLQRLSYRDLLVRICATEFTLDQKQEYMRLFFPVSELSKLVEYSKCNQFGFGQ